MERVWLKDQPRFELKQFCLVETEQNHYLHIRINDRLRTTFLRVLGNSASIGHPPPELQSFFWKGVGDAYVRWLNNFKYECATKNNWEEFDFLENKVSRDTAFIQTLIGHQFMRRAEPKFIVTDEAENILYATSAEVIVFFLEERAPVPSHP